MKLQEFKTVFVTHVPEVLEEGVLYVSEKYGCAYSLCPCGCGTHVPVPIKSESNDFPKSWDYSKNAYGEVTLYPSLLHNACPNKSHYFIRDNKIHWCEK